MKEQEETHQNEIMPMTYMGLDVTRKIGLHRILKVVCDELGADIWRS